MIFRYSFGTMIETDAVTLELPVEAGEVRHLRTDAENLCFTAPLPGRFPVYGLGETVRGINKRGWLYVSETVDEPDHSETRHSLYAAHNFLLVDGEQPYGLFFDYAGVMTFDIGYTHLDELKITMTDWNFDLYVIEGGDKKELVHQFRQLIGKSFIPPKWSFGYAQNRWSYHSADEVRGVVKRHRDAGVPLDMVYLDIDYMDHYKDFTVNKEAFGDLKAFSEEMAAQNIRLVPIIDAGIKQEVGYSSYDEGLEKGYFCTKEDGSPFIAAVWPGKATFVDVMNPEARAWFGRQYKLLTDKGIRGFWNDMNEPSIFYTEDRMESVLEEISGMRGENMDVDRFDYFQNLVLGLSKNKDDFKCFYHQYKGEAVRHDKVKNLFGYFLTRGTSEELNKLLPDERFLLISRSSSIGLHRYSGVWMGDNRSWWSHILLNMQMLPGLNMAGFLYTGCDLGGLTCDCTEDLMLRWLEMGIFYPLMRNHSAIGTRRQEFYEFDNVPGFRFVISMHYRLLPYLYSEFMKAALRDEMMFRPLAFDYPGDEHAAAVEDQLMLGNELMIAPVYTQNAYGRYVYLPERMKLLRFREDGTMEEEILEKGHHYVDVALTDVVFFLREGKTFPLARGGQHVGDPGLDELTMVKFGSGELVYELYDDDGITLSGISEDNIRLLKA